MPPWWKLVVKGQDLAFVFHHIVGDGMSGRVFHRELLDALNSADSTAPPGEGGYTLHRADTEWHVPPDPLDVWEGRNNILELIWLTLYWILVFTWYGKSYCYNNFPSPKPLVRPASAVAKPSERNVTRIVTHRIPASKMARIIAACRKNQVTFTPLFSTMLTIVLATEFYPTVKICVSRFVYDLRRQLPMDKIEGGTKNGIIFNATAGGGVRKSLGPFRKAIPFKEGKNPKIMSVRDAPIEATVVWPLVRSYKQTMTKLMYGSSIRLWASWRLLPATLEGFLDQVYSTLNLTLPPTHFVSNLGTFSAGPVAGEKDGGTKRWRITDSQFSVGVTNGNIGSRGPIFSACGVKGGDTVIHAACEEGVVTKEEARDILERVMHRIYELADN